MAYFDIAPDLLHDLLRLPATVKIVRMGVVSESPVCGEAPLRIVIEGDELPEVHEGQYMVRRSPQYRGERTFEFDRFVDYCIPSMP
jgi:hypothetical protein